MHVVTIDASRSKEGGYPLDLSIMRIIYMESELQIEGAFAALHYQEVVNHLLVDRYSLGEGGGIVLKNEFVARNINEIGRGARSGGQNKEAFVGEALGAGSWVDSFTTCHQKTCRMEVMSSFSVGSKQLSFI
jgi:hypothetical protein